MHNPSRARATELLLTTLASTIVFGVVVLTASRDDTASSGDMRRATWAADLESHRAPVAKEHSVSDLLTISRSAQLQRQCEIEPIPNFDKCLRTEEMLRIMSGQVHGGVWGVSTAKKLEAHVRQVLPDARVTLIECRETLCAVELTSASGQLRLLGEHEQERIGIVDMSNYILSYETMRTGASVTHTLRIFERR